MYNLGVGIKDNVVHQENKKKFTKFSKGSVGSIMPKSVLEISNISPDAETNRTYSIGTSITGKRYINVRFEEV